MTKGMRRRRTDGRAAYENIPDVLQPAFVIEILDHERKPVPEAKFSLDDGNARSKETDERGIIRVPKPKSQIKLSSVSESNRAPRAEQGGPKDEVETPAPLKTSSLPPKAIGSQNVSRDPFARPGQPGNRAIQYGSDGSIPSKYRSKMEAAIDLAYQLVFNEKFLGVFRETVSKLTGKDLSPDVYLETLDKMILHHAESSKDSFAQVQLGEEAKAAKTDNTYQLVPAFTRPNDRNVWIREFQLEKSPKVIAGTIMHEAAHVAGAPGNALAEIAIEAIHNAGYPRQ